MNNQPTFKKKRGNALKVGLLAMAVSTAMFTAGVYAQSSSGGISGTVNGADSTTTVQVTDTSRGVSKSVDVANDGTFTFRSLAPGSYEVNVIEGGSVVDTQTVTVGLAGQTSVVMGTTAAEVEEIVVSGSRTSTFDTSIGEIGVVISASELEVLPVARNIDAVTKLAPGVSDGDNAFTGTSFSGSSQAENTSYINGLNTTNFRNGLGFSEVPFEFYDSIQVKTGGYSAKYGRTTGGVINARSRSGTNEFGFGANVYYDQLLTKSPNTIFSQNDRDQLNNTTFDIYGSGPIIKDKLFFYGLYSNVNENQDAFGISSLEATVQDIDADFWGVKLDAFITPDHKVELTAFSDERETIQDYYDYDPANRTIIDYNGQTIFSDGGDNWIATYTGDFTDQLQVSFSAGFNEADRTTQPSTANIPVVLQRSAVDNFRNLSGYTSFFVEEGSDERNVLRLDVSYDLGDHFLEAGIDNEKNTSTNFTVLSGGVYWLLAPLNDTAPYTCTPAECPSGALARRRSYQSGGEFDVDTESFYIQDTWAINDNFTAELGLRNETFTNYNANGDEFVEVSDQWAPRLSLVWDPTGDGSQKVFGNYGLYYLPIASNTNIRLAGGETYIQDYFDWDGVSYNADFTPANLGAEITARQDVFGNGDVPDTRSLVDLNMEAMYQSEFILGYSKTNADGITYGVKGIYRNLETSIEDVAIDAAVIDYYNTTGTWDDTLVGGDTVEDVFTGFHQYVLTNPGIAMEIFIPEQDEFISLTSAQLGYPEAERSYAAIEATWDRPFDGTWGLNASYTWAHSWGNNEGYVRSDNGQDDAGLTTNYDQPGLTDGASGNLPNDRRHTVKLYGNYELPNGIRFGSNVLWQTGRPKNCFGEHPTDVFAQAYGNASFYCGGNLTPRGSLGTTPSKLNVDANVQYAFDLRETDDLTISLDIFNLLNAQSVTEVSETDPATGGFLGEITAYQSPTFYRLSARYKY